MRGWGTVFLHENGIIQRMAAAGAGGRISEFRIKRGPFRCRTPDTTNGRLLRTKPGEPTDAGTETVPIMVGQLIGARTTLAVPMRNDEY